jgi:hypothetical protein
MCSRIEIRQRIYARFTEFTHGCQTAIRQTISPLNYKIQRLGSRVFEAIAPRESMQRYVLSEVMPKVLKIGSVSALIGMVGYGAYSLGHLISLQEEEWHAKSLYPGSLQDFIHDTVIGSTIVVPIAGSAAQAVIRLRERGKEAAKDVLLTTLIIVGSTTTFFAGLALGQFIIGPEKLEEVQHNCLILNSMLEGFMGSGILFIAGSASYFVGLGCQLVSQIAYEKISANYAAWKENEKQLLLMEEGKKA